MAAKPSRRSPDDLAHRKALVSVMVARKTARAERSQGGLAGSRQNIARRITALRASIEFDGHRHGLHRMTEILE